MGYDRLVEVLPNLRRKRISGNLKKLIIINHEINELNYNFVCTHKMRGAQCTVRAAKPVGNTTRTAPRTVIGATLCEDAGHPVPQKVRPCGFGKCSQWHTTEWTPCETSRCFTWKTAMQRRNITCRLVEDMENGQQNITLLDPNKCDDTTRPLQRQECYNDACKGVWRVGEWSEVCIILITSYQFNINR